MFRVVLNLSFVTLLLVVLQVGGNRYPGTLGEQPGPMVTPTRGQVWPTPQHFETYGEKYMIIRVNSFEFRAVNVTCDILEGAIHRYHRVLKTEREAVLRDFIVSSGTMKPKDKEWLTDDNFGGYLNVLDIELNEPCEQLPYFKMDEAYEIKIDSSDLPGQGRLTSRTIWGILRGLESFVQLVVNADYSTEMHVKSCHIRDFPRFPYRGLMVDTARHFQPMPVMRTLIDGMEASKLNVLHWHLVDEQAFPYQSKIFPELSEKGAYHPITHVYNHKDVKEIVEYCRMRGIRVIPEFDTPGHTRSWGQSHPEILTTCYTSGFQTPDGSYGPIDPTKEETYTFMNKLFREVKSLFPDNYFHLGGDEVDFDCWRSNPAVQKYMEEHGIEGNYNKLEQLYISRVINITEDMGASAIVWQDVLENGVVLSNQTIVQAWKGSTASDLLKITRAGHYGLLSSCWYLDHDGDWKEYYRCDPHDYSGNDEEKALVIGGEACIWTEYADPSMIVPRVYPRTSAMAERLWSNKTTIGMFSLDPDVKSRLEEFRCKLLRRGVGARPVGGASFCMGEYPENWPAFGKTKKYHKNVMYLKDIEYKLRVEYMEIMNAM